MTLQDRRAYCRRQYMHQATSQEDGACWLAEYEGLLIGAGLSTAQAIGWPTHTARLRLWYLRGVEDGRVLRALEHPS